MTMRQPGDARTISGIVTDCGPVQRAFISTRRNSFGITRTQEREMSWNATPFSETGLWICRGSRCIRHRRAGCAADAASARGGRTAAAA